MPSSRTHLLAALLVCFFLRTAAAHDIQASNLTLCIRPTGIDIELTLALASGTLLIQRPNEPLAITPNTFQNYTDRLQSIASTLLTLTTSDHQTLSPDAATVSITDETDILYTLHFPSPPPGPFTLHAAYLDKMPATHTASFRILSARGDSLGFGDIHPDSPDFQVNISPASIPPAMTPLTTQPANNIRWMIRAVVAVTLLMMIFIARKALAKQPPDSEPPL